MVSEVSGQNPAQECGSFTLQSTIGNVYDRTNGHRVCLIPGTVLRVTESNGSNVVAQCTRSPGLANLFAGDILEISPREWAEAVKDRND